MCVLKKLVWYTLNCSNKPIAYFCGNRNMLLFCKEENNILLQWQLVNIISISHVFLSIFCSNRKNSIWMKVHFWKWLKSSLHINIQAFLISWGVGDVFFLASTSALLSLLQYCLQCKQWSTKKQCLLTKQDYNINGKLSCNNLLLICLSSVMK